MDLCSLSAFRFQYTAARRRLGPRVTTVPGETCFNTQPPEGGWTAFRIDYPYLFSFNTQPPEGGWVGVALLAVYVLMFQHTAARRRLVLIGVGDGDRYEFQHTAARRRLEPARSEKVSSWMVSTHSRPKAAGDIRGLPLTLVPVSTHSRPKAAGQSGLHLQE